MDSLTTECGGCTIRMAPIEPPSEWPEDGQDRLLLGDRRIGPLGAVRLSGSFEGIGRWSESVFTHLGVSVHDTVALCLGGRLAVIVQPYVLCFEPMSGEVLWHYAGNGSSLFGLYLTPGGAALILHGEMDILRLSADGAVVWRSSGRDIFTGPCRLSESAIEATDWNGVDSAISLDTGASHIVGQGKPYPLSPYLTSFEDNA